MVGRAVKVVDLLEHAVELGHMEALYKLAHVSLVGVFFLSLRLCFYVFLPRRVRGIWEICTRLILFSFIHYYQLCIKSGHLTDVPPLSPSFP